MTIERKYTAETRDRAVKRVVERRKNEPRNRAILREVAAEFEVGEQSLRIWVHRLSSGELSPTGTQPQDSKRQVAPKDRPPASPPSHPPRTHPDIRRLKSENAALKRTVIILAAEIAKLQSIPHTSTHDLPPSPSSKDCK